jgi:glutaminyl-tRNA synthetase
MPVDSMEDQASNDFIRQRARADLDSAKVSKVVTRFPPEPNGYLHIGHAKSICLNFGLAKELDGVCHLRFDDTNPSKEDQEYVDSIIEDVRWLGWEWEGDVRFASDYFEKMYELACELIKKGKSYVDDQTPEQIKENRGDGNRPGVESPFRDRSPEENLKLFAEMREGLHEPGSRVLRAKIDMSSTNLLMRDPLMYRINRANHHRTGDTWSIYPLYDWAHGLEDSIEGITHSICTLEFETHRPLYDWFLDELEVHHPQQIEFARLNLDYTLMSKRKLLQLVEEGAVDGWRDPRMPTLGGMRRRGFTAEGIRNFCEEIGVTKIDGSIELTRLEYSVRQDLNKKAIRIMGVLDPLKVVITNYPEGESELLNGVNNPEDESAGTREIPFSRELFIEREDFMEEPPRKFFRLGPGREVRLRYAYYITCQEVIKDETGEIVELRCTYDPETKGGSSPDNRKVKGTLHWVSANHAISREVRLYETLFSSEEPGKVSEGQDIKENLNPDSLKIIPEAKLEPYAADAKAGVPYQFERKGYFCVDSEENNQQVWNRTVTLKDGWKKVKK